MPLIKHQNIGTDTILTVWEIKESREELLSLASFTSEELSWFSNFRNEIVLCQKICTRILIKNLISEKVTVSYDQYSCPLLNNTDFKVSLSHSGPYVTVIICKLKRPGIDIEKREDRILKIENKFLSEKESKAICDERTTNLLLYWNTKEAVYKIFGKKYINFKDDIFVDPFRLSDAGQITANLNIGDKKFGFKLNYEVTRNYTLVWCHEHDL